MRVIARSRLRRFWEALAGDRRIAEADLSSWYKAAKSADWPHFGALKQTFGSSDQVGNCVVFDVGNNRFRLIGRVNYFRGIVYILRVMDHSEYDKARWVETCRCHEPPSRRATAGRGRPGPGAVTPRSTRGR